MVLSVAFPAAALVAPMASEAAGSIASFSASTLGTSTASAAAPQAAATPAAPVGGGAQTFATSPNPGTINNYEDVPGGASTEDPSIAYDTVSFEPILSVYETLVNYNGTSTSTFVPTLATCVPGTAQCGTDYPTEAANTQDLITYDPITGLPMYYTFVIDQNAKFYDPLTHNSWNVYPSDVVFSVDRTMAFADQYYVGRYNGWVLTQALLPIGNPSWDVQPGTASGGLHFPYNNTPYNELSSILVNDSTYCPASAMSAGHGCVTFEATGGGTDWPFFLELVADDLGAGVEPCGVFTYDNAGLPGWTGSSAPHGDGPCLLPGGATSTDDSSFQSFLTNPSTGGNPLYWDSTEMLAVTQPYPDVQTGVTWTMTGSGPYYAYSDTTSGQTSINVGLNYSLHASPAYAQPAGCAGLDGYAAYPDSYCDPAAGSYPATVNTYWEQNNAQYEAGIQDYISGTADFATILPTDAATIVALSHTSSLPCNNVGQSCTAPWYHSNKVNVFTAPSLSNFAFFPSFEFNESQFAAVFSSDPQPQLPSVLVNGETTSYFFSGIAVRGLLSAAYPYASIETSIFTYGSLVFQFNAGGPIPAYMGNYYPTNFTRPYQVNGGVPDANCADVGSPCWWFTQGTTNPSPSNPYYDPLLASCLNTTCKFPIEGEQGLTSEDDVINAFIPEIELFSEPSGCHSTSCAALQPYLVDVDFATNLGNLASSDSAGALYFLGWAPDYPDPTDYMSPYAYASGAYTGADSVFSILNTPAFNNSVACGHSTVSSIANLGYWGAVAEIPQDCQMVAYAVTLYWQNVAAPLPPGTERVTDYTLISKVLDKLYLYTWQGQTNVVGTAAPWIAVSSVNTNPTIGGGGDILFYQLKYAAPLTVHRAGIPANTAWGINVGGQNYNTTGLDEVIGAAQGLTSENGFSPIAPAGYALAHTTPLGENPAALNVPVNGLSITLVFAKMSTVTVTETGLPIGTNWTVTLTPPLHWYPTTLSGYDIVTSLGPNQVTFTGIVAGVWDYKVTSNPAGAIAGFKTVPLTVLSSPLHGAPLVVPNTGAPVAKSLTFTLATAVITFTEGGLPLASHPTWSVTVSGTEADGQAYGPVTVTKTAPAAATFDLPQGTYTYSFGNVVIGANTYTATGGSITLGNLHPWLPPSPLHSTPHYPVHATYADPPAAAPANAGAAPVAVPRE
jgi:hypothetical protein